MTSNPTDNPVVRKVFICNNGECTSPNHALEIYEALLSLIHDQGLDQYDSPIRIKCMLSGCLDVCENGPVMVVHPGAVFYQNVQMPEMRRIFEQHLLQGKIVEDLVVQPKKSASRDGTGS